MTEKCREEYKPLLIPEPEGWVAKSVIGCLRSWREAWKGRVMIVTDEDIDSLETWADSLHRAWLSTDDWMKRNNIPVIQYPVQISKKEE
jgi:hypothetical protein